eukprot:CAMPEP_0170182598 /NCGR_PEP_ID=MMETSP0040_2-20121228/28324_1 /TAXON_ID=641309 /ORGANISM="Lotharella oceanica, Strain CCMP622" /LENGTH=246 /DNA_ID=CAMNT_0010428067 /DNA_START=15 /DNA_END=755 /DNA_ORIENTATION=+
MTILLKDKNQCRSLLTHRFVLQAVSKVFRDILANDRECTFIDCSCDLRPIHGIEVSVDDWIAFVSASYPFARFDAAVSSKCLHGVAALAKKYDAGNILKCVEIKLMSSENITVDVLELSNKLGLRRLQRHCLDSIMPAVVTSSSDLPGERKALLERTISLGGELREEVFQRLVNAFQSFNAWKLLGSRVKMNLYRVGKIVKVNHVKNEIYIDDRSTKKTVRIKMDNFFRNIDTISLSPNLRIPETI